MHDMSPTRRNVRLLGWFNFCNDFRIYGPVMVVYFAQVTGSYADAVLILAIAKIGSSLFELPTGVFSDFVGRRKTLLSGQIANILCIAAYGAGSSFTVLAIGALLEGLSFALFSGNQDAFLYDTLKDEEAQQEFAEYQGRLSAMFQAALAVSALVSAIVLLWLPLRSLFWLSLVPQTVGLVIGFLTTEPARHGRVIETNLLAHLRDALVPFRRDAKLRDVSIAAMLGFALGEAKHMFFPAYFATLWSSSGLGIASMLTHAFAMLGFRASRSRHTPLSRTAGAVVDEHQQHRARRCRNRHADDGEPRDLVVGVVSVWSRHGGARYVDATVVHRSSTRHDGFAHLTWR